jgi:AcrR family transcriptional regulator
VRIEAGRSGRRRVTARSRPAKETTVRTYGDETRELILKAAQKLFATRGLHETSMQDIADEARVSRATVFNQFGSKHLVLDAITARSLAAYRDLLAAALADDQTPTPDLVRRLFEQMSGGLEKNRALYREVFTEIRKLSMGLDPGGLSPRLREEAFDIMVRLLKRGQARGDVTRKYPPDVLATAFDSLLSGAVIQWLHDPKKGSLSPLLSSLLDVLLNGAAASRR